MKTGLKISIGLNVILTIAVTALWVGREKSQDLARNELAPMPTVEPTNPLATLPASTIVTQVVAQTMPFRWSQIVSSNDYRIFVANLRAAGCPEQTVEEIVWGDVEQVFSTMRTREGIDGSVPGPWSGQSQVKLGAYLLGQTPPEQVAEAPPPPKPIRRDLPLETPLALQNVDLNALGLNNDQIQMVASVRQDFLSQTGGMDENTNSVAYHQLWRKAQMAADNMLLAQLGSDVYNKYQLMAYQTVLAHQTQN